MHTGAIQSDVFRIGVKTDFKIRSSPGVALKETVRAEPVEACSRNLRDAQSAAAASVFVRLCPSTSSGRTVLLGLVRKELRTSLWIAPYANAY